MPTQATVAFFDLSTESIASEALSESQIEATFTKIVDWVKRTCTAYGGAAITSYYGGVVIEFPAPIYGISAAVYLKRAFPSQFQRYRDQASLLGKWPPNLELNLKIGLAHGPVTRIQRESFKNIIDSSAYLSRMAGMGGILADESFVKNGMQNYWQVPIQATHRVTAQILNAEEVQYRSLGWFNVPGFEQPREAFQMLWRPNLANAPTVPGILQEEPKSNRGEYKIRLSWLMEEKTFDLAENNLHIGRGAENDFIVGDTRVSREHALIRRVGDGVTLTDISKYGTFVKFDDEADILHLKHTTASLRSNGEIALGENFSAYCTTIVRFELDP